MTNMYQTEQTDKTTASPADENVKDIAQVKDIIKELRTKVTQLSYDLEQSNQRTKRLTSRLNSLVNEVKRLESMRR